MPRGTTLTDYEKTKIKIYRECGLSNSSITKKIGRSRNLINNFFSLCENYGKMKRTGRIPLLSPRDKRTITRLATSKSMFASEIRDQLYLPVGIRRVQQVLQASDTLEYTKRLPKPALTKQKRGQTELGKTICYISKLDQSLVFRRKEIQFGRPGWLSLVLARFKSSS